MSPFSYLTVSAVEDLIGCIDKMGLSQSVESSLAGKLAAAARLLGQEVSNDTPILALLDAFARGVGQWYGKGKLTLNQRNELLDRVELIRLDVLQ